MPTSDPVATSPERVCPLLNGVKIPQVSIKTADGTPFDLVAAIQTNPAVLGFYRGGRSKFLWRLKPVERMLDLLNPLGRGPGPNHCLLVVTSRPLRRRWVNGLPARTFTRRVCS